MKNIRLNIKKTFKETPLGLALGKSSPEQWKRFQEQEFESAKKLSDFIAILMRASFCAFLFLFFQSATKKEDFWLTSWIFNACSLIAIIILGKLYYHISGIIIAYWLSDTAYWNKKIYKIIICFSTMIITGSLGYGIFYFVFNFAKGIGSLP